MENNDCIYFKPEGCKNPKKYTSYGTCEHVVHPEDCWAYQRAETTRDPQSRHYDAGGIEVQDVILAKLTLDQYAGWCIGNALKYLGRANWKESFWRDVEKARNYLDYLLETQKEE